jgi:hypothetical protein
MNLAIPTSDRAPHLEQSKTTGVSAPEARAPILAHGGPPLAGPGLEAARRPSVAGCE